MVTARRLRSEAMKGGPARAPNRSYLRAMGMSDEDIEKPFVAVASTWNEATPCNVHLDRLADRVKQGVKSGGGTSREFVTIAEELYELECVACPGEGSCAGMYTANTMACASEALGMALPYSGSIPASDPRRDDLCRRTGEAALRLLDADLKPRDILTKEAFENAIAVVVAIGGSTNAVLHLLAIAREADVPLVMDDFERISCRTPHIADTRPGGRYVMVDLDRVGGVPRVMKELLDAGLVNGDAMTVTGKTVAENLAGLQFSDA